MRKLLLLLLIILLISCKNSIEKPSNLSSKVKLVVSCVSFNTYETIIDGNSYLVTISNQGITMIKK